MSVNIVLPEYVADPTLTESGIHLPLHVADPTQVETGIKLPLFLADPTVTPTGIDLSPCIADPTQVQPGLVLPQAVSPGVMLLPFITFAGDATQGNGNIGNCILQPITLAAQDSPNTANLVIGSTDADGNRYCLTLSATAVQAGQADLTLAPIQGHGILIQAQSANLILPKLALAAEGYSGRVGNVSITLPAIQLAASGGTAKVGSASLTLPLLILQSSSLTSAQNWSALAMHTERQALTTYTNYPFNSFMKFNGVYLAVGSGGVFALSGATDDGVIIQAAARVGIQDYGTSHLKKIDRMYVGYRSDGDLTLRVITDETTINDYPLAATHKTGITGQRGLIGKGLSSRYWQFEIQNVNGSDFELNAIEVLPRPLKRRIGA